MLDCDWTSHCPREWSIGHSKPSPAFPGRRTHGQLLPFLLSRLTSLLPLFRSEAQGQSSHWGLLWCPLTNVNDQELSGKHASVTLTGLLCGSVGNAVISSAENAGDQHGVEFLRQFFSTFISFPQINAAGLCSLVSPSPLPL